MTANPFDQKAATWDDDPAKRERARVVAGAIRTALPLAASMRMLEYGAGTGLVTQQLGSDVGPVTVADSSSGMVAVLRAKAAAGVLGDATVWELDLGRDPVPDGRFDLVVTVMALHHITDVPPVLRAFATLLEPGGHLCVVDLEAEDGSFHADEAMDVHDGFDRDDLLSLLEDAGFVDVRFSPSGTVEKHGRDYPLFLAVASRP